MTHRRREKIFAVAAALAAGFAVAGAACTVATPDDPESAAGSSSSGGSGAVTAGTAGSIPSGAGSAQAGSVGTGQSGSGGAAPTGGSTASDAGSGGSLAAGGVVGSSGSGGSGGAPAATGCGWVQGADGTWTMNPAPADKVVLFDGKDLSQWHRLNQPNTPAQWKVLPDGSMEVVPQPTPTNIQSNAKFDDACLHVEYKTPTFASDAGVQQQGNSGVYLKSAYEMQVLDTSKLGPLIDGCGAVYKVAQPLLVACLPYGEWNTYEIEFKGSVWDTATPAKKTQNASFVRVALNKKLVQQNVPLNPAAGFTEAGIPDVAGPQPIALQDHREPVDYRNIWVSIPRH
jgi:Domain of Unknown Function (DUF1080)